MDEQILKYFENRLSLQERLELLRALELDESLKKQFMDCQKLKTLVSLFPQADDVKNGKLSYQLFIRGRKIRKLRRTLYEYAKYAVVIILVFGFAWRLSINFHEPDRSETNKLYVPAGQRACLTLNDGTKVWLNAQSTLEYPAHFASNERRVHLTGEALFEVEKSAGRPFIVSAGELNTKVLGTRFNVRAYPENDYVSVSLLEGLVELYVHDVNGSVILRPNEEAHYRAGKVAINQLKDRNEFLWTNGIYHFEKETLAAIAKKLELYYDVRIAIKNPDLLNLTYTAKFRQQDGIDEILRQIQNTYQLRIKKDTVNRIINLY